MTFYDGDDLTAKVLGQYGGSKARFKLYTSTADVTIQFQSDPATNVYGYGNGFVVHFFGKPPNPEGRGRREAFLTSCLLLSPDRFTAESFILAALARLKQPTQLLQVSVSASILKGVCSLCDVTAGRPRCQPGSSISAARLYLQEPHI